MADNSLGVIGGKILLDISDAMANLTQLRQQHLSTFSAMGQAAGTLSTIGNSFTSFGVNAVKALASTAVAYGEFERKLDYMAVVANASTKEVDQLGNMVRRLGADTIYTNDEIAVGFTELAKSGVKAKDILGGIGEGITYLGAAADIGLGEAATMMMSVVQTWGMAADEANRVGDVLAGTANASMVEISDLGVSMKYAGSVAASLGISFDDVSTALGLLGQRAIKGSTAGTSLRQIMVGLVGNTNKATKEMERLGIITEDGSNKFFNQEGKVKSLAETMEILREATAGMGEEQRIASLKTMFNVRALPSLLTLLDAGTDGFEKMTDAIQGVSAADVAGARLDNLSGDIELLMGEVDNLKLSFGELTSGGLRPLVQMLESVISWFNGLSDGLKGLIINITLVVSAFSLFVGGTFKAAAGIIGMISQLGMLIVALNGTSVAAGRARLALAMIGKATGIGLIITLIAGLVAAIVYFFAKTEEGQAVWAKMQAAIAPVIETITQFFSNLVSSIGPAFTSIVSTISGVFSQVLAVVGPIFTQIGGIISQIVTTAGPLIGQFVSLLGQAFSQFAAAALPILASLFEALLPIGEALAPLIPMFLQAGVQILAALQPLVDVFTGELMPAISELGGALSTAFSAGIIVIVAAFSDIITQLAPVISLLIAAIAPLIGQLISQLAPVLMTLIGGIIPIVIQLFQLLAPIITQLVTAFMPLITTLVGMLLPVLTQIITAILPVVITLFQAIVPVILMLVNAFVPLITTIISLLIPAIQMILDIVVTVFEAIIPIITAALDIVVSVIETVTAALKGDWEGVWNGIKSIVEGVWNLIVSIVQGAITLVSGIIESVLTFLSNLWQTVWGAIGGFLTDAWNNIVTAVATGILKVVLYFENMKNDIVNSLTGFVSKMLTMGEDLIQGLVNGLRNAKDWVINTIEDIVGNAIDFAKGLLGIKSPSRVFMQIGEYVGEGLAIGIAGTEKQVAKAMDKMLSSTKKAFQTLVDERTAAYKKLGDLEFSYANQTKKNPNTLRQINEQRALITELNRSLAKQGSVLSKLEEANTKMLDLADQRALVTSKLTAAQKQLKKLEDGQLGHYGDFLDEMQKAVSVTNKKSIEGMIYAAENQIEKTKEFNDLISGLKARGLDQNSLDELIEQFMSNGSMASAKALAGASDDAIQQLIELRKQLGVEAEKTAITTGSIMYDAGIDAAQGLVDGLQSELDAINGIAQQLADTLVTTIKSELGIRSPSRVTKALGGDVMAGLIIGVADERARLGNELSQVADQIAQFTDDVLTTKQFEIETMLTLQASDMVAADMAPINYRKSSDSEAISQLVNEVAQLKTQAPVENNYEIGDIIISLEDLEQLKTLEDFMEMIRVRKKQRGN